VEERHRKIAEVALLAAGQYSLALAGGYAVAVHGMGSRPSGDVDLFLDWSRRGEFDQAVTAVITSFKAAGMETTVVARGETFARLLVAGAASDADADKVELAADWRSHEPVLLEIGPVLHADDAVTNKMAALFGRALARDFLDVDAIIAAAVTHPSG
jgi:nucleotidyltransferase AbiEii toxin of type IV toxin-antitoxin system